MSEQQVRWTTIAVRLNGEQMGALAELCEGWGLNRSDVIREAVVQAAASLPVRESDLYPPTKPQAKETIMSTQKRRGNHEAAPSGTTLGEHQMTTTRTELRDAVAFKPDDLPDLLKISRGAVYAMIHDGTLPSVRVGRRLIVPAQGVRRLLGVEEAK